MSRIAVLGSGAWGTAITVSLARRGSHDLTLWAHDQAHAAQMMETRENARYLPGFNLAQTIAITSSLQQAVARSEIIFLVTPSQFLGETVRSIAPHLTEKNILISASKGLEDTTHRRMSQVMRSLAPAQTATLGGPSFAQEVASGMPTACVLATTDDAVGHRLQSELSSESLRVYRTTDVVGVELGGALKNVIALAAGVTVGLGLGANTAAALMTRGIAEIVRLGVACGASSDTLHGLAGMGDLVLTCTGSLSRNRTVGVELGRGRKLPDIIASLNGKVAEGVRCTAAALGLARERNIEMPITEQMNAVLHHDRDPREAIRTLMTRPGGTE